MTAKQGLKIGLGIIGIIASLLFFIATIGTNMTWFSVILASLFLVPSVILIHSTRQKTKKNGTLSGTLLIITFIGSIVTVLGFFTVWTGELTPFGVFAILLGVVLNFLLHYFAYQEVK